MYGAEPNRMSALRKRPQRGSGRHERRFSQTGEAPALAAARVPMVSAFLGRLRRSAVVRVPHRISYLRSRDAIEWPLPYALTSRRTVDVQIIVTGSKERDG